MPSSPCSIRYNSYAVTVASSYQVFCPGFVQCAIVGALHVFCVTQVCFIGVKVVYEVSVSLFCETVAAT